MKLFETLPDKYVPYISQIQQRQGIATLPTYIETTQYEDHKLVVEVADWMRRNAIDYNAWCRRNPSIARFSVASDSKPVPWCADASLVPHKRNHTQPPLMDSYLEQIEPFIVAQQPSIELTYANTYGGVNEVKLWDRKSCPVIAGCIVKFSREGDENPSVIFVNPRAAEYYQELISRGAIFTDPQGIRPIQRQIANMRREHNRQYPSIPLASQRAPFGVSNERAVTLPELNLTQRIVQVNEQIATEGCETKYVGQDGIEWTFVTSGQVSKFGGMGHAGLLTRVSTVIDSAPQKISVEPTHPLLDEFLSNLLRQGYVTSKQMLGMYPEEQLRYVLYKLLPAIPGLQKSQYDAHNMVHFLGDPVEVNRRIADKIRISLKQKPDFQHILGDGRVIALGGSPVFMQESPTSQKVLGIGKNEDDEQLLIQGLSPTQYVLVSFIISQGGAVSETELGDALDVFCKQQGIEDVGDVDRVRRLCRRSNKDPHIFGPQRGIKVSSNKGLGVYYLSGDSLSGVLHKRRMQNLPEDSGRWVSGGKGKIHLATDSRDNFHQFLATRGIDGKTITHTLPMRELELMKRLIRERHLSEEEVLHIINMDGAQYKPHQIAKALYFRYYPNSGRVEGGVNIKLAHAGLAVVRGIQDNFVLVPFNDSDNKSDIRTKARILSAVELLRKWAINPLDDKGQIDMAALGMVESMDVDKVDALFSDIQRYIFPKLQYSGNQYSLPSLLAENMCETSVALAVNQLRKNGVFITADMVLIMQATAKIRVTEHKLSVEALVGNLCNVAFEIQTLHRSDAPLAELLYNDLSSHTEGEASPEEWLVGTGDSGYSEVEWYADIDSITALANQPELRPIISLYSQGASDEEIQVELGVSRAKLHRMKQQLKELFSD